MKKTQSFAVAMLIDSWFPFYGGGQVHVKNLKSKMEASYSVKIDLFYAGRQWMLLRVFWSLVVFLQVLFKNKKENYSIIHSHGFIAGLPAKWLSLVLKVPVVHTVHGSHLLDKKAKGIKAWFEKMLLTRIKYSKQISVANYFLKYKNVNKDIAIIPNGVNIAEFDKVRRRRNRGPSIIWVGRQHPDKGIDLLKEAIGRVRKKIPKLKVELVTGGRLSGESLINAYKKARVFVLPSLAEGQPITLLEAWAAKLPVIVTRVGDNELMVKDGVNGILIDAGSTTQLVKAILKVLRSSKKADQMGLAGYRMVKKEFLWDKVAKRTYTIYKDLLK